jgi:hypothetical protein
MVCDLNIASVDTGPFLGLTLILWWSSGLRQDANRLVGACWSEIRSDFRQRFAGDYSPVDDSVELVKKIAPSCRWRRFL